MKLTLITEGLKCDRATRIVSGLMLPYGEDGHTNLGTIRASKGVLEVQDRIVANLEHEPTVPMGLVTATDETDAGRTVSIQVLATTRGDDLLAEVEAGVRTGLSVEVDDPIIRAGELVGGRITGVAFCVAPAFPSAQLAASDVGDDPAEDEDEADPDAEVDVEDPDDADSDLEADALEVTPETTIQDLIDAIAPPSDPTPPDPASAKETPVSARSLAPGRKLAAGAPKKGDGPASSVKAFASQLAAAMLSGDRSVLATLADIVQSGVGGDVAPQAFLGELWSGKGYERRFVPLMAHADLTSYTMRGWRWVDKPEVSTYSGNKTDVPSNTVDTEEATATAQRLAGAHDIDRKLIDFSDSDFLESYLRAMTESYAVKSDAAALTFLEANATAITADTVPTGVSAAAAALVDGALALVDVGSPSFAILGTAAWRSLLLTPKDSVLEFLSMSLGLESGDLSGFRLVPGGSGLNPADVIVGISGAATFYELPGSPIRVDALDIAHGGADYGLFGYFATMLNDAQGLVKTQPVPASINAGADYAMTVGDPDGTNHAGDATPITVATYADGSTADVTADAVLTSGTTAKATIVNNKVHAVAAGTSVITSTYQGKTDTVTVTVS